MRSFIIYLNFVSLLAVCLFACNHHSSNPMLQQVDSLLEMKPDSALTILKNISVLEDLLEADRHTMLCCWLRGYGQEQTTLIALRFLIEFRLGLLWR